MAPMKGRTYCFRHSPDPDIVARRFAANAREGKHTSCPECFRKARSASKAGNLSQLPKADFLRVVELVRREFSRRARTGELGREDGTAGQTASACTQ